MNNEFWFIFGLAAIIGFSCIEISKVFVNYLSKKNKGDFNG